jgi:hypothetical protein
MLHTLKCIFLSQNQQMRKLINKYTKVRIYKTIIRPVVTYGCETWVLNQSNKERLDILERRILRKIYGPVRDQHDEWRIRWKHELYQLYKDLPISAYARIQRLH